MSPQYASEAQRRKFHELAAEGKISAKVVREYDDASKGKTLPERVHGPEEAIHATMAALNS